jgi:hypothetical protein
MEVPVKVILEEAEIIRINPQPGDVLLFKFSGDQFSSEDVNNMGRQLRTFFPNNKCIVMTLPDEHNVELTVVANQDIVESTQPVKDCSQPTSYCNDCSCGKKERLEAEGTQE